MYSKHFKKCRTISEKKYYLKLDTKFLQIKEAFKSDSRCDQCVLLLMMYNLADIILLSRLGEKLIINVVVKETLSGS